jgi:predicted nucleic acid-binding protein
MINALIDTNIILDGIAARKPFDENANAIFDLIECGELNGFISASSITDIYYLLCKSIGYDLSVKAIDNLLDASEIITITKDDCINARKSDIDDFEDALIVECAGKENLDYIVTRDNELLCCENAVTPEGFLQIFNR